MMLRGILLTASLSIFSVQAAAQTQAEANSRVNLRSGLGPPSQIVAVLEKGEKVTVLAAESEYAKVVTAENEVGFVKQRYLVMSEKPAAAPVVKKPMPVKAAPVVRADKAAPASDAAPAIAKDKKPRKVVAVDEWPPELRPGQKLQPPPKRIYTPNR